MMFSLQFVSSTRAKNPTLKKASTLYNCKGEGGGNQRIQNSSSVNKAGRGIEALFNRKYACS